MEWGGKTLSLFLWIKGLLFCLKGSLPKGVGCVHVRQGISFVLEVVIFFTASIFFLSNKSIQNIIIKLWKAAEDYEIPVINVQRSL